MFVRPEWIKANGPEIIEILDRAQFGGRVTLDGPIVERMLDRLVAGDVGGGIKEMHAAILDAPGFECPQCGGKYDE